MTKRAFQVAGEILHHTHGMQHVMSLDSMHEKIHDGEMYSGGVYWSSIADAGTALTSFVSGTIMPHGYFEIAVGGNCKMTMYEGGTLTGGSAASVINHLRSSANAPLGSMSYAGTLTGGTAIAIEYVPGGEKNFSGGGNARAEHEIVGLINTLYTVELVNVSGGAIKASVVFNFYEENY